MGRIVECVEVESHQDVIPGIPLYPPPGGIPYVQYRGWFRGELKLNPANDATGNSYKYDMPVWIVTPRTLEHGNGTVLIDPLHSQRVQLAKQPPEGEQSIALKILGPSFLFRKGQVRGPFGGRYLTNRKNYTWIGVRWDPNTLGPWRELEGNQLVLKKLRFDHVHDMNSGQSAGSIDGTDPLIREDVGHAMVAALAEEARGGVLRMRAGDGSPNGPERSFAQVKRVIGVGHSQTARLLAMLLHDPPPRTNGSSSRVFDGWMILGARGTYEPWSSPDMNGVRQRGAMVSRPAPLAERGKAFDIGSEQDIHLWQQMGTPPNTYIVQTKGNEWVRFGNAGSHRSYEVAGASHLPWGNAAMRGETKSAILFPDLVDSLDEQAALAARGTVPPTVGAFDAGLGIVDAYDCTPEPATLPPWKNPLDWNPVVRALLVALEAWIDGTKAPPIGAWLQRIDGSVPALGDPSIVRGDYGNALGGVQLPDVFIGRGRFYAPHLANDNSKIELTGAYVDHHERFEGDPPPRNYVDEFSTQAKKLVTDRFLLQEDCDALIEAAKRSRIGGPHIEPIGLNYPKWRPLQFIVLAIRRLVAQVRALLSY